MGYDAHKDQRFACGIVCGNFLRRVLPGADGIGCQIERIYKGGVAK